MSTLYYILIIFIFLINGSNSISKFCDTGNLFQIGIKVLCESESGLSTSCLKNPKKAYIQCQYGYKNKENISQQIINCMDDGQWSETPLKCDQICISNSNNQLILLENNQITYPTSYVEIFKNKLMNDKQNKFPGIILFERKIMSNCDYIEKDDTGDDYSIRIFNNNSSFKEIRVFYYEITRIMHKNKEYCIFNLGPEDYIKYNDNIMPNCIADDVVSKLTVFYNDLLLPAYKKKCYIPDIDKRRTEVVCYDRKSVRFFETVSYTGTGRLGGSTIKTLEVDCAESADIVIIRCRLGTNNTKSNDLHYISKCSNGEWTYQDTDSNDCNFVCGEIDAIYEPSTSQLLYKGLETNIISAPWHVAIFANNTDLSDTFEQICGGSIIHSNLVISAAHCFYDEAYGKLYGTSNYLVGAGKNFRSYDVYEKSEHYNGVKNIRIAPTYQSQPTRDDIAILILDHHFIFTSHIKPVCIEWAPYENYLIEDRVVGRTFGWGSKSKDRDPSRDLLTIELVTKINHDCKKLVNPNLRPEISSDKFCATNSDNATACRGDSGGGFVIKRGFAYSGYYILAGVISVGLDVKNYCSSGFLSLFTNIQFYQDFIKSVITETRYADL